MTRYEPADSFETPRFSGVRTFMRLPNVQDLENADVAVVVALMATRDLFSNDPILYGMLVSLVVFVVVSLLTPRPSEERMRTWEHRMRGTA